MRNINRRGRESYEGAVRLEATSLRVSIANAQFAGPVWKEALILRQPTNNYRHSQIQPSAL